MGAERGLVHLSPFGVIPKKEVGKWRLIVDLSHPSEASINDGIEKALSSIAYVSVDNVAEVITALGQGVFMGKCDVQSAYRNVPIHPHDAGWLGLQWEGVVFVDTALPFGLRSAPKVFTAIADAFQWIVVQKGVKYLFHYIDDFITVGRSEKECQEAMQVIQEVAGKLGLPMEPKKTVGPTQQITFLGVEIDSVAMEVRLPQEKLVELLELLEGWLERKHCIKEDLESLTGKLQYASRVVRPGRCFLWHLYAAQAVARKKSAVMRVSKTIRADVRWWYTFAQDWNGTSLLWSCGKLTIEEEVWTDASGGWGYGAWWKFQWLSVPWAAALHEVDKGGLVEDSIAVRELVPVVVAAAIWGQGWRGKLIQFNSDNMSVVEVVNKRYSKKAMLMHLLRCLVFFAARESFWFCAQHVPGVLNGRADALSRGEIDRFHFYSPQGTSLSSTQVPKEVTQVILDPGGDWVSDLWTQQFKDSLMRD